MPEDDPREPRFDTTPAPRLGPADPLRGRREAPEEPPAEEAAEPHPALTIRMVVAGIIGAAILTSGIVYAVRRSAVPTAPPPVTVPQASAPQPAPTVAPAETPPPPPAPVTPPPPAAPPPSPPPAAIGPKPIIAPSPAPAIAPPPALHPAHPPHPDKPPAAAVPSSGPKHRRRSTEENGDWLVQVGAYRTQDHADLIVDTLSKHGWKPHTVKGKEGWILVEITGYRTHDEAATAAGQLAAKEHVPTLVRRVIPKSGSADH
jgi:cell division septation protein DedD